MAMTSTVWDTRGRTVVTTQKFDPYGNEVSKEVQIDGILVHRNEAGEYTRPAVEGIEP